MHLMPVSAIWINKIMLTHMNYFHLFFVVGAVQIFRDVDGDRVANTHGEKNVLTREICPVICSFWTPEELQQYLGKHWLHPRKPTWQRKNNHVKMYLLLNMAIVHCHVSFLEGNFWLYQCQCPNKGNVKINKGPLLHRGTVTYCQECKNNQLEQFDHISSKLLNRYTPFSVF